MATADRVLPWRRHHSAPIEEIAPLLTAYRKRHPKASVALVNKAYEAARVAHISQQRSSGEAYINHPIAVARIVADIGLDDISLAAALLHDAVEDTEITLDDVQRNFGDEVAGLVDGVTKLERLQFDSREAQQAATMRKMLVAMARDMRVLIIKLADRLHNMRTLAGVPLDKQQRIAQETLDIYAPLANRLGMQEIKQQLEDLSFAALYPKRFAELDHLVSSRTPERDVYLETAITEVRARLADVHIIGYEPMTQARTTANRLASKYEVQITPAEADLEQIKLRMIRDADVVLATSKAGVEVLGPAGLATTHHLLVAADVNAVPPAGIAGVDLMDDGKRIDSASGKTVAIGALAIGNVKYQTMQRMFRSMVKAEKPVYYDFRAAFSFARAFVAEAR